MNKIEKELVQIQLKKEQKLINNLKKQYEEALKKIEDQIKILQADDMTQSKIYQMKYQEALKGQIEAILSKIQANSYQIVDEYIKDSYTDGWVGTFYNLKGQGIPIIAPIDQSAIVKAVQLNTKLSMPLYEKLGVNIAELKKSIRQELSRGLASGQNYRDISRNISNAMGVDRNKSIRIARTEGHRVQNEAKMDAFHTAKEQGSDVVKQWDSSLDKRVRPSHQKVDGEIREIDEQFSNGLMYPGDKKGKAKEVVNCRCVMLERARWALDDEELEYLKERAEFYGLDKTNKYKEFKNVYIQAINSLDYMGKPYVFNNGVVNIKCYAVKGTDGVYAQTYSADSQKLVAYIEKVKDKLTELNDVERIIVAKDLPGIAAYDHENNWLFINERVMNKEYITKQLESGYFVAENVYEILQHEMFHKKHWENIKTKEKKYSMMKSDVEANLRKYVATQQLNQYLFLKQIVSENASDSFKFNGCLNELIAEVLLQNEKSSVQDEMLLKLVKECVGDDGTV